MRLEQMFNKANPINQSQKVQLYINSLLPEQHEIRSDPQIKALASKLQIEHTCHSQVVSCPQGS